MFIEITHGNEDGTLNTQWIPLPLSHITKVSKEKKTHYGKKNRASQESNSSVKGGKPQKQNFDLQTIDKFLATHISNKCNTLFKSTVVSQLDYNNSWPPSQGEHHENIFATDSRSTIPDFQFKKNRDESKALELGVDKSTIFRELTRNIGGNGYHAKQAQLFSDNRRKMAEKHIKMTSDLKQTIREQLCDDWSPDQ